MPLPPHSLNFICDAHFHHCPFHQCRFQHDVFKMYHKRALFLLTYKKLCSNKFLSTFIAKFLFKIEGMISFCSKRLGKVTEKSNNTRFLKSYSTNSRWCIFMWNLHMINLWPIAFEVLVEGKCMRQCKVSNRVCILLKHIFLNQCVFKIVSLIIQLCMYGCTQIIKHS